MKSLREKIVYIVKKLQVKMGVWTKQNRLDRVAER